MGILPVTAPGLSFYPHGQYCSGTVETGSECRFAEFWNSKGSVGTLVLIGVWWACELCTALYTKKIHLCISTYNCFHPRTDTQNLEKCLGEGVSASGGPDYHFNDDSSNFIRIQTAKYFLPSGSNQSLCGTMPTIHRFPAIKCHVTAQWLLTQSLCPHNVMQCLGEPCKCMCYWEEHGVCHGLHLIQLVVVDLYMFPAFQHHLNITEAIFLAEE